jgi:hypothetical protein
VATINNNPFDTYLSAVTTTGESGVFYHRHVGERVFQAAMIGTGSVSATVVIYGSNDGVTFVELATISLSGTGSASDGFYLPAPWRYTKAAVTAISGTGAAVTVTSGM